MSEFFSKIETFIFDLMGLVLPGIIFLAVLISPSYLLNISSINQRDIESSYILSGLTIANSVLQSHFATNTTTTITLLLILAYLVGHVVKVFSIIKYDFLTVVFDKSFNKFVLLLFEEIKHVASVPYRWAFNREISDTQVYQYCKTIFGPIRKTLEKVFVFRSDDYERDNDSLKTECIAEINQRLTTNYPNKWYSLYKISVIINSHEGVKSLAGFFLAKYNLYRSLALIFMLSAIYYEYFFRAAGAYISHELLKVTSVAPIISLILWFTFHYKYKRYWTLCGNETLVSLYYRLKKHQLNAP